MAGIGIESRPGDPAALRTVAFNFQLVEERSQAVATRLRSLSAAVGPGVWRGQSADAFLRLLSDLQYVAGELAAKNGDGARSMNAFIAALESAQDTAVRAESAGEEAMRTEDAASRDRAAASAEVAAQVEVQRQIQQRLAEARALEAAASDPVYLAELKRYEHEVFVQLSVSLSRHDAANGKEAAARVLEGAARTRLGEAHVQGDQARQARDDASRLLVSRLQAAMPPPGGWETVLNGIKILFKIPGYLEKAHELLHKPYSREWNSVLRKLREHPGLRKSLQYRGSSTLKWLDKFSGLRKLAGNRVFGIVSMGLDLVPEGISFYHHLRSHDKLGMFNDVSDMVDSVIPTKNPTTFLIKFDIALWSHVVTEATKVDWHDLPNLQEIREYGWESLQEAWVPTGKIVLDSTLESI